MPLHPQMQAQTAVPWKQQSASAGTCQWTHGQSHSCCIAATPHCIQARRFQSVLVAPCNKACIEAAEAIPLTSRNLSTLRGPAYTAAPLLRAGTPVRGLTATFTSQRTCRLVNGVTHPLISFIAPGGSFSASVLACCGRKLTLRMRPFPFQAYRTQTSMKGRQKWQPQWCVTWFCKLPRNAKSGWCVQHRTSLLFVDSDELQQCCHDLTCVEYACACASMDSTMPQSKAVDMHFTAGVASFAWPLHW